MTDIHIIDVGMTTPIGLNREMSCHSVLAGIDRFGEYPYYAHSGNLLLASFCTFLEQDMIFGERLATLASMAMTDLLEKCRSTLPGRCRLFLGVPDQRPGWNSEVHGQIIKRLQEEASNHQLTLDIELVSGDRDAGLRAIKTAAEVIALGSDQVVVAGAVDSYCAQESLDWLDQHNRLKSGGRPDGLIPGEGAAFVLLTSETNLSGRQPLGGIERICTSSEEHGFFSETPCQGAGLTQALQNVLHEGDRVDYVVSSLNGESFFASEWMYAYLRSGRSFRSPLKMIHPADCWGDLGAASGSALTGFAVSGKRKADAEKVLIFCSSDGGTRSALLLNLPALN